MRSPTFFVAATKHQYTQQRAIGSPQHIAAILGGTGRVTAAYTAGTGGSREFIYQREGDYAGLLKLEDVTTAIGDRLAEVPRWVHRFREVLKGAEPAIATGAHCQTPFDCPFFEHCQQFEDAGPDFPLTLLPNGGALVQRLVDAGCTNLREVPADELSRDQHLRMLRATRSGKAVIEPALAGVLASLPYPR